MQQQPPVAERANDYGDGGGHQAQTSSNIRGSVVTIVEWLMSLGTNISWDLKWERNMISIAKTAQQRKFFLRKLLLLFDMILHIIYPFLLYQLGNIVNKGNPLMFSEVK